MSERKTPWLALAALSCFTAYGLWQIAIRQPDPIQVRFIDLPPVTEAALLTSGIDRQTLSEYLELKTTVPMGYTPSTAPTLSTPVLAHPAQEVSTAPGRIRTAPTKISSLQTREKRDGHSRALTKAQLAAEVRAALPKLPNAEVEAAVWIIWRESGGRTTAKNPRSSSHGLNGFLRSTWRNVTSRSGIRHGLDPHSQILAMHHYVTRRYGSFRRAKAHHVARRWY